MIFITPSLSLNLPQNQKQDQKSPVAPGNPKFEIVQKSYLKYLEEKTKYKISGVGYKGLHFKYTILNNLACAF